MKYDFKVYKGLQRPLTFKGFNGKYIYIALGTIGGGLLVGGLVSALHKGLGFILMAGLVVGGYIFTTSLQKRRGLYNRRTEKGAFIPIFKFESNERKRNESQEV